MTDDPDEYDEARQERMDGEGPPWWNHDHDTEPETPTDDPDTDAPIVLPTRASPDAARFALGPRRPPPRPWLRLAAHDGRPVTDGPRRAPTLHVIPHADAAPVTRIDRDD